MEFCSMLKHCQIYCKNYFFSLTIFYMITGFKFDSFAEMKKSIQKMESTTIMPNISAEKLFIVYDSLLEIL